MWDVSQKAAAINKFVMYGPTKVSAQEWFAKDGHAGPSLQSLLDGLFRQPQHMPFPFLH